MGSVDTWGVTKEYLWLTHAFPQAADLSAMSSAKQAEKSHATRKLVDIAQKARGRTPLKYELEVIPFFAGQQSYKI